MSIKQYLLFFLLLIVQSGFSQQQLGNNQFSLAGTTDLKDGEIIFLQYEGVNDSTTVKNGKFHFKGRVDEPTFAALKNGKTNVLDGPPAVRFFIEPVKMDIIAWKDKFYKAKLSGSETQKVLDEVNLKNEYDVVRDSLEFYTAKIQKDDRTEFIKSNLDSIYRRRYKLFSVINERKLAFLKNNPTSYLSPFFLVVERGISQDSIRFYYN